MIIPSVLRQMTSFRSQKSVNICKSFTICLFNNSVHLENKVSLSNQKHHKSFVSPTGRKQLLKWTTQLTLSTKRLSDYLIKYVFTPYIHTKHNLIGLTFSKQLNESTSILVWQSRYCLRIKGI